MNYTWQLPFISLVFGILLLLITLLLWYWSRKKIWKPFPFFGNRDSVDKSSSQKAIDDIESEKHQNTKPLKQHKNLTKSRQKHAEKIFQSRLRHQPEYITWNLSKFLTYPLVKRQYRVYKYLTALLTSIAIIAFSGAALLAGRPSSVQSLTTAQSSHDIVFCLDVSPSALPFDKQIISTYLDILPKLKNERLGMSIFNSTSKTVFPLTNDYALIKRELNHALNILYSIEDKKALDNLSDIQQKNIAEWLAGTQLKTDSSSLIGDGLMSCEAMMPNFTVTATQKQARVTPASIILATDNVLSGTPVYTLQQALNVASLNSIQVDGLYSGAPTEASRNRPTTKEMQQAITSHGGLFLERTGNTSVRDLVRQIESKHASEKIKTHIVTLTDQPLWWTLGIGIAAALLFIIAGKVRR